MAKWTWSLSPQREQFVKLNHNSYIQNTLNELGRCSIFLAPRNALQLVGFIKQSLSISPTLSLSLYIYIYIHLHLHPSLYVSIYVCMYK